MADVQGFSKVVDAIRLKLEKVQKEANVAVVVGYTAKYAVYVHENLEQKWEGQPRKSGIGVYWGPNGQPKFLEQPARGRQSILARIVRDAIDNGLTLSQALLLAGYQLQAWSQELVPVEYGDLRASAFTRLEEGGNIIAG